jgi:aspartyl-tRNA(Asn)/glutamyl-tRNA(Gln) amidotransferase subunit A
MVTQFGDMSSALEIHRAVRRGAVSVLEIVTALADRVAELNPALNAIVNFDSAAVFTEARRVDQSIAAGDIGALAGMPFTVKDCLWVKGRRATQGSLLFRDFVAPSDAIAVGRLRAAGAVFFGMTNCSEFACKGVTSNLVYGTTRNPWNLERTSGGSSGGAASAVAAGISPLAVCTDSGGSTRRPAAMTGVVGMKPSPGVIPHAAGFEEPTFGNGTIGAMARSVDEVKAMLEIMVGPDERDPSSMGLEGATTKLSSYLPESAARIAYSAQLGLDFAIASTVAATIETAVGKLRNAGLTVANANPKWPLGTNEAAFMPLQHAALAVLYGSRLSQESHLFDPDIALQIEAGLRLSGADVARALLMREKVTRSLAAFFEEVDILLCPTVPVTAWPIELLGPTHIEAQAVSSRAHAAFTPLFNHAGVPACSVPCGLAADGLPVGLQVVGPRMADALVLSVAKRIEEILGPMPVPF